MPQALDDPGYHSVISISDNDGEDDADPHRNGEAHRPLTNSSWRLWTRRPATTTVSPPPLERTPNGSKGKGKGSPAVSIEETPSKPAKPPANGALTEDRMWQSPARPSGVVNATTASTWSRTSPSSTQIPTGGHTPDTQTAKAGEWTVERIEKCLQNFAKDVAKDHGKLLNYILISTFERKTAPRPQHLSSVDYFAGPARVPASPVPSPDTMRFKIKQHGRESGRGKQEQREVRYKVISLRSDKEKVPKYRFHHVGISRNILSPNTMLKFVPHLRDILGKTEEKMYETWLDELTGLDYQSGFKTLNRSQKIAKTMQEETATTLSLYLERWIKRLNIEGCSKSTLIRYMASQPEKDDAITPQQKSSIINSYSDDVGSPRSVKGAQLFTDAFNRVFNAPALKEKAVTLHDVLLLDESVETIVDTKRAKETGMTQKVDEDWMETAERDLASYSILGCLICFSHSCEHGEYDAENQKRNFSVDSVGRLLWLMKQRWVNKPEKVPPNGTPSKLGTQLCKNQCFRSYDTGNRAASVDQWTDNEESVLRCLVGSLGTSQVKAPCAAAVILGRRCWEVYRKQRELNLTPPEVEQPPENPKVRVLGWYDRNRKMLLGDWQDQTVAHEHARREFFDACHHDGPCSAANNCPCVRANILCEHFCRCTAETCAYKFTGCACHSSGKTCYQRQKEGRPCICVQLNRECDPVLCKGCGAYERADPQNAQNEALHSTGCQNCMLQRGVGKTVLLGKSQLEGCGYGLFTAEDIAQDEFIIEYTGELITHDEGVRREARRGDVFDEGSSSSYLFTLLEQEGIWVDAAVYGNLSRYINHAGESEKKGCNITPKILYVGGDFRIRFTALRDIRAGEELFFNYGENFPNLTKKLLDNKEGESNAAAGAGATAEHQEKRKVGRPRASESTRGVARKTTKRDKDGAPKAAKPKGSARKEAPDPTQADAMMDWEVDSDYDDYRAPEVVVDSQDDNESVYGERPRSRRTKRGQQRRRRGAGRVYETINSQSEGNAAVVEDEHATSRPTSRASRASRARTGGRTNASDSDSGPFMRPRRGRMPGGPRGTKRKADLGSTDDDASDLEGGGSGPRQKATRGRPRKKPAGGDRQTDHTDTPTAGETDDDDESPVEKGGPRRQRRKPMRYRLF